MPVAQLNVMWAGIQRGVPTINGYSGHSLDGWMLLYTTHQIPGNYPRIAGVRAEWVQKYGLDEKDLCWIEDH